MIIRLFCPKCGKQNPVQFGFVANPNHVYRLRCAACETDSNIAIKEIEK